MATYLGTHGSKIQNYTTDPDNPNTGEVWYNETANTLKFQYPAVTSAGSWRTGVNLPAAKKQMGQAGTYNDALAFGGETAPAVAVTQTEKYDGSSWTELNDLSTAVYRGGGAGQDTTSILSFGGRNSSNTPQTGTDSWNGTNWTEVNSLNDSNHDVCGSAGASNTSALCFGGDPGNSALTELWNGSNWTEVNDLNAGRGDVTGVGIATSALAIGGWNDPGNSAANELWNGTNWTEVGDINTARHQASASGVNNTSALFYSGYASTYVGNTEEWNGTSWTETTDMSTARAYEQGGAGTSTTNALCYGGEAAPGTSAAVEEWTGAGAGVTRTFTDS